MIHRTYNIEFLTPCFCAGANQIHAELRPSAIRGELRWWFRCLGGSLAEEKRVFGGVHGDTPLASSLSVRSQVQSETGQRDWHSRGNIPLNGMEPRTYLLGFFCGRTQRLQQGGAMPPGCKARVLLTFRHPPSPRLELALRAFFSIGALGFRATRAAGAIASEEHALSAGAWGELAAELVNAGFNVLLLDEEFPDWVRLIYRAGDLLKNRLRSRNGLGISAGKSGGNPNALGSADPRQASALHLRPVRVDGALRLALIEAPHHRVLGRAASRAHGGRGSVVQQLARQLQ